jgi:hypothetical protein
VAVAVSAVPVCASVVCRPGPTSSPPFAASYVAPGTATGSLITVYGRGHTKVGKG